MKNRKLRQVLFAILLFIFAIVFRVNAQVATGGQFTLNQSVIATGGGTSTGGIFTVEGTTGQSVAGQQVSHSPLSAHAGFWNGVPPGPSAANVSVSGRVQLGDGRGIRNVSVRLVSVDGTTRIVLTGAFGGFRFDEVMAGETYIVIVSSKHYRFQQSGQTLTVINEITDLLFTGDE